MEYREKAFRQKFADAATLLGVQSEQVASLKIRENVGSYQEYHKLLHALEHEADIRSRTIQGNYQGTGYLVEKTNTKVIVVEHETGLEILYIAGSIASLLSLIPLILRCWSDIRGNGRHRPPNFQQTEIRRLGNDGRLIEECNSGLDVPWAAPLSVMNTVLMSAAETIDLEIQRLKASVLETTKRIEILEKNVSGSVRSKITRKTRSKKTGK